MARVWDILPPRKKPKKLKPAAKKARRSNTFLMFFLIVIASFFIVFYGSSKLPTAESEPLKTSSPKILPESPKISPTGAEIKTQAKITLKILNGTGRVEETEKVKELLTKSGFNITATENALNVYHETTIYFQPNYESYANQIATILSSYNPKVQKFTQETKYEIVVVIGSK